MNTFFSSVKTFLLVLFFPFLVQSQNGYDITYVANEGFMIETQQKKIIIDGLFDQIEGDWCDSPDVEMLEKMKNALPPFDEIDLIAVTHKHRDHFNDEVVISHLLSNKQTQLICPHQVYQVLKNHLNFEEVKDRITAVSPEMFCDSNVVVSDIAIRVLRLEHSHYELVDPQTGEIYNKHRDIENLGFVFDLDGNKIFHCGDTNPKNEKEYQTFNLFQEQIEVAFLERQFLSVYGKHFLEKIDAFIHPQYIFLMHINPSNKDYFGKIVQPFSHIYVMQNKLDKQHLE